MRCISPLSPSQLVDLASNLGPQMVFGLQMATSKGHRWTNQALDAWIQRVADVTARLHFPEVVETTRRLQDECASYHKKLRTVPVKWIESMRRMSVGVLHDFADCIARVAEMVSPESPTWSKANSDIETVRFLAEYYTWEHLHLDGQSNLSHPSIDDTFRDHFPYREEPELCSFYCQMKAIYPDQIIEADCVSSLGVTDVEDARGDNELARDVLLFEDKPVISPL